MSEESLAMLEDLALSRGDVEGTSLASLASLTSEPIEIIREITALDVPILLQELREHNWGSAHRARSVTQILRTSHHQLAQILAAGVDDAEASFITGRSTSSISSLRSDPAFKELLTYDEHQQRERDISG